MNNFDFLRILFAAFVIITHSFPTTLGFKHESDWLGDATKQTNISVIGLAGFFCISGFLIFKSLKNSKSLGDYYRKRCLRIFPGLFGVLLFSAVGFFFLSDYTFMEYFGSPEPWTYIWYNFNLYHPGQGDILNTVKEHPDPFFINVSIWTIRYEFFFYICTSLLFFIPERFLKVGLILSFLTLLYLQYFYPHYRLLPYTKIYNSGFTLYFITDFGKFFVMGALLAVLKIEEFRYQNILLAISLFILPIALYFNFYLYVAGVFLPLAIIILGLKNTKEISGLNNRLGFDPSYGIYLYGFVIQQVLVHYFTFTPVQLMITTIPLAFFAGYLSWHLVEKRAIRFKLKQSSLRTTPAIAVSQVSELVSS